MWARHLSSLAVLLGLIVSNLPAQGAPLRKLTLDDAYQLREVSAPEISPDGEWVAYTVGTVDSAKDRTSRDLWMTSWDE
jgi:hypothetical protein